MPLSGNERRLNGGGEGINSRASAEAEKSSSLWTFWVFLNGLFFVVPLFLYVAATV